MSNTSDQPTMPKDTLLVGSRVEMWPSQPQSGLDAIGGRAYSAAYKGGGGTSDLITIVCDKGLQPRLDSISAMRSIDHPSILRLIDSGVVEWPQDNVRRFALAYQRPATARMKQSVDEPHAPMSEDFLNHHFIIPMINVLMELQRTGMVHNAIRPDNIFWRIGGTTVPQLGECLSAPAGVGQPVLFEPLERAMCMPMGRGMGQHADDCYSFGVVLAMLIAGGNPLQGMSDNGIIQAKMDRGSFITLVGNQRITPSHIEILRGLLADDARQRWTATDLEQWTNGRRQTPKSTDAGKRAARAFEFEGQEFWTTRPLAAAMSAHVSAAAHIIENGSLDKWLRRALMDDTRATNMAEAQTSLKQSGRTANYEDQLVTRACIALDPPAPIRYRTMAVMPMGIVNILTDMVNAGSNPQILCEIITSQMVSLWIEMQQELKTELVPLGQQLERMKNVIEKANYGNGVERVIYDLNPNLPCLSPIVRTQFVTSPKTLLQALERVATMGDRPAEPMDRHIAAFLIVRERRSEALFVPMTEPQNSPRRGLSLVTLYSEMQDRHGPDALPHLAQWLMPMLEPVTQSFLSKTIKERLRDNLKEAVKRGNLALIGRLLNDPRRAERDQQEFMAARMLYLNIAKEIAMLENRLAHRDVVVQNTGKPLAASICTFIAILLVFAAVLHAVWVAMIGS